MKQPCPAHQKGCQKGQRGRTVKLLEELAPSLVQQRWACKEAEGKKIFQSTKYIPSKPQNKDKLKLRYSWNCPITQVGHCGLQVPAIFCCCSNTWESVWGPKGESWPAKLIFWCEPAGFVWWGQGLVHRQCWGSTHTRQLLPGRDSGCLPLQPLPSSTRSREIALILIRIKNKTVTKFGLPCWIHKVFMKELHGNETWGAIV